MSVHVYVVFCHPSRQSFTYAVLTAFLSGLHEAGHTYEVGDLYEMGFRSDMDPDEYRRETSLDAALPVPADVAAEQEKIARAQGLALVYPVWWSDGPAKLKGWFDRVWTYGYAYRYEGREHAAAGVPVARALALCPAGHPVEHLEAIGIAESMRRVMAGDRLAGVGIGEARLEILGGMTDPDPAVRERNLARAAELGRTFFGGGHP